MLVLYEPTTRSMPTVKQWHHSGLLLARLVMTFTAPNEDPGGHEAKTRVGLRIRALRRRQNMTLVQCSGLTGLDKGYLSRLERGEKFASVGTLHTLARALDVPLSDLLGEADPKPEIDIVRAADRALIPDQEGGPGAHLYEAITPGDRQGGPSVLLVQVGTHGERAAAHHAGEEIIFVLEGRVQVQFGEHVVQLGRDDSVRFPGYLPHSLSALDDQPARALVIIAAS